MKQPQFRRPIRNLQVLGLCLDTANPDAYAKGATPPMVWAGEYGTVPVVRALVARGINVDAQCQQGGTALYYAAANGRVRIVRLLLAAGADPNRRENDGYTAIICARTARIGQMLLNCGAKVNAAADSGITALHEAAELGTCTQVEVLLAHGANANVRDEEGETPLMWAASMLDGSLERVEVVQRLLNAGASISDRDNDGHTALWHAAKRRSIGPQVAVMVKRLVNWGADVSGSEGQQLLAWAKKKGYDDLAEILSGPKPEREL